jgi:hypothetical protein
MASFDVAEIIQVDQLPAVIWPCRLRTSALDFLITSYDVADNSYLALNAGTACATTLTLATDVAPAAAADVAAGGGGGGGGGGGSGGFGGGKNVGGGGDGGAEKAHLSPSIAKSALQKSVRRSRVGCAAKTCAHLLAENPSEALRRLVVISIEDALLHPSLPLVVGPHVYCCPPRCCPPPLLVFQLERIRYPGPGRYCWPRQWMPSRNECSKFVLLTWRAISAQYLE